VSEEKQTPEIVEATPVVREEQPSTGKSGGWFAWWRKPKNDERQIKALQQGFVELVDLTRSIREHMDQQARTQKAVVDLMQHLPGAVEGLQHMGKATEQQTETLSLLRKQLETSGRHEEQMVEGFRNFNRTLELMDQMSKSTSQTVTSMAERTRDSEDMLRSILERSEKRLMYMIVTLMAVTVLVLGVGLYIGMGSGAKEDVPAQPFVESVETPLLPLEIKKMISDLGQESSATTEEEAEDSVVEDEAQPDGQPEQLAPDEHDPDELLPEEAEESPSGDAPELEDFPEGEMELEPVDLVPDLVESNQR